MIVLDTDICIAFLKDNPLVTQRFEANIEDVTVPAIVAGELLYGAFASQHRERNLENAREFLSLVPVIPFTESSAEIFGRIKAELRAKGRPTGELDATIAAIAVEHNAILITHNTRHYESISSLQLDDWLQ